MLNCDQILYTTPFLDAMTITFTKLSMLSGIFTTRYTLAINPIVALTVILWAGATIMVGVFT
jgi:hypothetical protein